MVWLVATSRECMETGQRSKSQISWDRYGTHLILSVTAFVGVVLVALMEPGGKWEHKLGEHLAMGIAVAGLIGFLIEVTLHKRFADNVFKAAVGYLLREDLRGELEWIYEQTILCTELNATVHLEHHDGLVKVTSTLKRTLKNISLRRQPVVLRGGADEWFVKDKPTKVIEATYRKLGDKKLTAMTDIKPTVDGIGWGDKVNVNLAPDEEMDFTLTLEQWQQEHDEFVITYRYPTKNPSVTVKCDDSLIPRVIFDHRAKYQGDWKVAEKTWHPRVMLLAHQDIRLKWHPKADLEARKKSFDIKDA
jgi:hypothetical protein